MNVPLFEVNAFTAQTGQLENTHLPDQPRSTKVPCPDVAFIEILWILLAARSTSNVPAFDGVQPCVTLTLC